MHEARAFECAALRQALEKAHKDSPAHNRLVGEARGFYNRAVSVRADPALRATAHRTIDTIMMSGRIENKGLTIAKSFSTAPNRAIPRSGVRKAPSPPHLTAPKA